METTNKHLEKVMNQVERFDSNTQRVAMCGISLFIGNDKRFFKSTKELVKEFSEMNQKHIYKVEVSYSDYMFKSIEVRVELLEQKEINKPSLLVKLARNINAMDLNYQMIDDLKQWKFYNELDSAIRRHLSKLDKSQMATLLKLTKENNAKHFKLC